MGTVGRLASVYASEGLWLSAVAWVGAYGLFVSQYAPILLQPRVDCNR
ncbi:NnrS family protein [Methylolobus aquaticus]